MKKIFAFTLLLLVGAFLPSCYRDKSALPSHLIEEVRIDTTAIGGDIYIGYQELLVLTPKIVHSNPDKLTYRWTLSETSEATSNEVEEISTARELHYQINRAVSTSPYRLSLLVQDTANQGLEYIVSWKVYVQSSMIGGLLIVDTRDGATTDLTYIKHAQLSRQYNGTEKIYRKLLSSQSESNSIGLAQKLAFSVAGYFGRKHVNLVWLLNQEGVVTLIDPLSYRPMYSSQNQDMIIYRPGDFKVSDLFVAGPYFALNTTNGIYKIKQEIETQFTIPYSILQDADISPGAYATNSAATAKECLVWYSASKGQFAFLQSNDAYGSSHKMGYYHAGAAFDPNALPNKQVLSASMNDKATFSRFIMRDKSTCEHHLYLLHEYTPPRYQRDPQTGAVVQKSPEVQPQAWAKYDFGAEAEAIIARMVSIVFSTTEDLFLRRYTARDLCLFFWAWLRGATAL